MRLILDFDASKAPLLRRVLSTALHPDKHPEEGPFFTTLFASMSSQFDSPQEGPKEKGVPIDREALRGAAHSFIDTLLRNVG